jgi:hypothetical protein
MEPVWAKSFQKKVAVMLRSVSFQAVSSGAAGLAECREYNMRLFKRVVLTFLPGNTLLTGWFGVPSDCSLCRLIEGNRARDCCVEAVRQVGYWNS